MKKIGWVLVSLSVLIAAGITGCDSQDAASEDFAIFLTRDDTPVSQMPSTNHYELTDEPVIFIDDIVSYTRDTHEIELIAEAFERVKAMKVPTTGKSFVVCVGQKQIYWGAFWAGYSSQSFNGVIIGLPSFLEKESAIRITLGYPSADFFQGKDPRPDTEIFQSLEKAGKLR